MESKIVLVGERTYVSDFVHGCVEVVRTSSRSPRDCWGCVLAVVLDENYLDPDQFAVDFVLEILAAYESDPDFREEINNGAWQHVSNR